MWEWIDIWVALGDELWGGGRILPPGSIPKELEAGTLLLPLGARGQSRAASMLDEPKLPSHGLIPSNMVSLLV